jgi:murein DD-endopeptidase MepM/ murein hydrolase activator NlpD
MINHLTKVSLGVTLISLALLIVLKSACGADVSDSFTYPMSPYVEVHRYYEEWAEVFGKYHAAQDLLGNGGDPVYAVANGVVSYSYGEGGEWAMYGYVITIDHELPDGSGVYSLYGHLSTRRWKRSEGEEVHKGDIIGYVGDDDEDGSLTQWGPHLHFGIRIGKKSDYYDFLVGYYSDHPALHGWIDPGDFIGANLANDEFPDLTGQWNSLTQRCRSTRDGPKCKITGKLSIQNMGTLKAHSSFVRFYLSTDNVYDEGTDTFLKQKATGTLRTEKNKTKKLSYRFHETASGMYIVAVIDADNTVAESDESNNYIVFGPIP